MITAECYWCGRVLEVPSLQAQVHIMVNKIACKYCAGDVE